MTTSQLEQAIEQADIQHEPGLVFSLLPELEIWNDAPRLLASKNSGLAIALTRGIGAAFSLIKDKLSANTFLVNALDPELDSLLYGAAADVVVDYAANWDEMNARKFYNLLEDHYRGYLQDPQVHDVFIARCALESAVMLAIHRNDNALLLSAQGLLVNRFPPLPIDPHEIDYVVIRAVQLLGRCYDCGPELPLARKINELTQVHNVATVVEARFNWGIVQLYKAFQSESAGEFRTALHEARQAFSASLNSSENRSDAELLLAVIDCYIEVLWTESPTRLPALIKHAESILIERTLLLGEDASFVEDAAKFSLIHLLIQIKLWSEQLSAATQWPSILPPMDALSQVYAAVRTMETSSHVVSLARVATESLVMLPKLRSEFLRVQAMADKLTKVLTTPGWRETAPTKTVELYELALRLVQNPNVQSPKDEATAKLDAFLAVAEETNPLIRREAEELRKTGKDEITILFQILERQFEQSSILNSLLSDAAARIHRHLLPDLSQVLRWSVGSYEWLALDYVVRLIAHYYVEVNQHNVPEAPFLFAEEAGGLGLRATERHLQDHFYDKMHMSFAVKMDYEPNQVAPGRPDLAIRCPNNFVIPVEVKCENQDSSRASIQQKYVAQAQHYAAALSGVSFLFVLDIVPKDPAMPPRSNLDYCYLDSYPTPQTIHPVIVIVFVFPANRYQPSSHTNPSSKSRAARKA